MSIVFYQCLLFLACFVGDSEHKKSSKRQAPPIPTVAATSPQSVSPQPSSVMEQTGDAVSNSQPPTEQQGTYEEKAKQQIKGDKQQQKQEDKRQQKQEDKQQNQAAPAVAEDTSSYVVIEKKIEDIIKEFDTTVGTELVEAVRTKLVYISITYYIAYLSPFSCDINHAKSLTAVQVVLDFISSAVPQLQPTLSAMLEAVHKSQVAVFTIMHCRQMHTVGC